MRSSTTTKVIGVTSLAAAAVLVASVVASATIPTSQRFRTGRPVVAAVNGADVTSTNQDYMQGFGFAGGSVYTVTSDHQDEDQHNNPTTLRITRLVSGHVRSHMLLKNFHDHGSEVAFEHTGSTTYVWLTRHCYTSCSFKTHIDRLRYLPGKTLQPSSRYVHDVTPRDLHGTNGLIPVVDTYGKPKLVVHWKTVNDHFHAYGLADAAAGGANHLIWKRTVADPTQGPLHQGMTVFGQYAYFYEGSPKCPKVNPGSNCTNLKRGNTYVTSVNLKSGAVAQRTRIIWKYTMPWREPEGISVRPGKRPAIAFGFVTPRYGSQKVYVGVEPTSWPVS